MNSDFLAWIPGSETVKIFEKKEKLRENPAADLFSLDFNALHRVGGGMEEVLSEMKAPFIMIDHHQNQMIMPLTAIRHFDWIDLRNAL
jgi:phosphoesterase RecJ-like protein